VRIAHLADLHIGFRRYDRTDARGMNQREVDVEAAVRTAIDGVLAAAPDLVVVAGDIFHSIRPTGGAVVFAFKEFARLRGLPVIIVAGNHDTPKSVETGDILLLLEQTGARVVMRESLRVEVAGVTVTAVPSWITDRGGSIPAPSETGLNVLVVHGDAIGYSYGHGYAYGDESAMIRPFDHNAALEAGYDYIALGDYHCATMVKPGTWYAGAVEFTSSNPWAEIAAGPKGWLLVELEPGDGELLRSRISVQHIPVPTRRHIDIPPLYGGGMDAPTLDRALAERFTEFPIAGAVARLIVLDVPRAVKAALDHRQIARWKAEALNLQIEFRRPESEQSTPERRAALHQSLDDKVRDFLGSRDLPPGVDRPDLIELGMKYLEEARAPEESA